VNIAIQNPAAWLAPGKVIRWRGICTYTSASSVNADEVVMVKEDRRCAFCGKEILWNEEFSMKMVRNSTWHRAGAGPNILKRRLTRNGMVRIDRILSK
jgi:hypothetical protein